MEYTIIVPCCGQSKRFPGCKPKFLLSAYDGKIMLEKAIEPLIGEKTRVIVVILKEHEDQYHIQDYFSKSPIEFVVLPERTRGPADTVAQAIIQKKITGPIFIKDCDSFFSTDLTISNGNFVCTGKITDSSKNIPEKSFVVPNNQGLINHIVEKEVVSDTFCVGGYAFEKAESFLAVCKWHDFEPEVFISDIISLMIFRGDVFLEQSVTDYVDVGTKEAWIEYNNKPTIFCDIDGTIVKTQSKFPSNSRDHLSQPVIPLVHNVINLLKYQEKGCQFVFTTSRPWGFCLETRKMLDDFGFKNYCLLMNLHHSPRILINDYNSINPYPSALAVNLPENEDTLGKQMMYP